MAWLNNTDKEVECFHPVCKEALDSALAQLGLDDKYEVQHHRYVGSIEMDLVIANKSDNRILCVIEVKRTISAVNSTRYQYQAMSYVQSLSKAELKKPYYLLTNLEASCLFKFDAKRKNVYEQILKPGIKINHFFDEVAKDRFMHDLVKQYADYLNDIINDRGEYLLSFSQFADEISQNIDDDLRWKKNLVGLMYEYIRGSFTKIGRQGMKSIGQLSRKVDLVCQEGLKIDFKDIFSLPTLNGKQREIDTDVNLLKELFELGKIYVDADELANVMHKVISNGHEHEGEVPTDSELADIMLWLVRGIGGNLKPDEKIMDPSAGSGSLICAAADVLDSIQPNQIIANDINPYLLQLLSLRLGLKFATTITPHNTATISIKNIADLDKAIFDGVKYIVMNPPYLAATGKNCSERKKVLYSRIKELKGAEPVTLKGQMPLEGVFLELISALANKSTLIAAIIPTTHLTTKGEASVAIRKMLLDEFGLQFIFSYPQENLFESVNQNTSIVIGIKDTYTENVKYLHCNSPIFDVNPSSIKNILAQPFDSATPNTLNNDFDGCEISRQQLLKTVEDGWIIGNIIQQEARNFLNANLNPLPMIETIGASEFSKFNRGKIGNNGCTDLMFLRRKDSFLNKEKTLCGHLSNGFNNANYNDYEIGEGDSVFVDASTFDDDASLKKVIADFLDYKKEKNKKGKDKKQRQENKSIQDYFNIMKNDSNYITPSYSVLLPRALRSKGRVFITTQPVYVSTNFFVFQTDKDQSVILSSWMSTVFFQLECEAYGNNRSGLRKMEEVDYKHIHIPVIKKLSNEDKDIICKTSVLPFLNLRQPKEPDFRPIDKLWAEILFKNAAYERLNEAADLLAMLVAARER